MNNVKEYDVLRLIEHNRSCHVCSDTMKGCSLAEWMKYHPHISKEQLYWWIKDIIRQLMQIHKCSGNPSYQYVNPFSIIISETGKLSFMDVSADSNQNNVRKMQRRNIREYFLPENESYYCGGNGELDIYGLGKTIQYILAFVEVSPKLTKWEEKRFHKMIMKCTQKKVKDMHKLLTDLK